MTRQHPRSASQVPDGDRPPSARYSGDLAREIEQRWQERWEREGTFHTPDPRDRSDDDPDDGAVRPKVYVMDMFPYPSGSGLHVGHPLGFIGTDVYSRYKRMTGHHVMYTMGFDAFGLPAEQYAVQTGQHPAITTEQNIATYRRQLRRLGLSHDDRRSVSTADPTYYRWTQWIFVQIFQSWYDRERNIARPISELIAEYDDGTRQVDGPTPWAELDQADRRRVVDTHRLAYVGEAPVNWCPGLGTVVANEEVTADGRSDRGNFPVFKRNMRQWMMRITDYADRLIDDLDLLDWSDAIKAMQRNWIGRSVGANVRFAVGTVPDDVADGQSISVFTTRPDTLFGATFLVLAPEHPLVESLTTSDRRHAVDEYRAAAAAKDDITRQSEGRAKTGVFTGATARNPITGEALPVWIADYVLMGYGTGAIMAVPCGDQRDFEFARTYDLPIVAIQRPPDQWFAPDATTVATTSEPLDTSAWPAAYVGEAPYVNSTRPGLDLSSAADVADATRLTIAWLEAADAGEGTVTYKLRDWLFSRQRYWGEPFPIVYDDDDLPHALSEDQLPLVLPDTDSFSPRTFEPDDAGSSPQSPLAHLEWWVDVEIDLGDGPRRYRRDTNVMPQWAGSCWYELRYLDPTNELRFVDADLERYWMGPEHDGHPGGVDLYVGGVEHAVLHLLYSRFWHKVLYDLGHVSSKEPFYRLYNQGYILAEAFVDERGIYVDAAAVVRDGDSFTHEGRAVTREWGKMGKSLKNAVAPDEIYDAYGADTLRLHEMAMGPLDASRPWETRDVVGMYRFLQRVWRNLVDEATGELRVLDVEPDADLQRLMHRTIADVRDDMDALRFNTAIAKLIELNNALTKLGGCPAGMAEPMILMLAPLAPHIAEELWTKLGHEHSLTVEPFPVADEAMLVAQTVEYPVQVNGKVRARLVVPADTDPATLEQMALANDKVIAALGSAVAKKVIVVPGRMINIVV